MVTATQRVPWMVRGLKHGELADGWLYIRDGGRTISIKLVPGLVVESQRERQESMARLEIDALGRPN